MSRALITAKFFLLLLLLQGCSNDGFHLRKSVKLAPQFTTVSLDGLSRETDFKRSLSDAVTEAGGKIVVSQKQAKSIINFSKFEEGRRIIAFTSEREVREYLLYLNIEYSIQSPIEKAKQNKSKKEAPKFSINIDRSYLYDDDFALGKAEEAIQVKQILYEEATRLIMLRLKYAEK